jgi:hypothetical protein
MKRLLTFVFAACNALAAAQERPVRVDLRQWQTPVRNQGGQGSCFIHANVAAMEAAYKRLGYGDLNLSEDFSFYLNSLLWLKATAWDANGYRTASLRVPALPERESGLPFFDQGPQSGRVDSTRGCFPVLYLPIPAEADFPQDATRYQVPWDQNDPQWHSQRRLNNVMLESRRLPRTGLTARNYYQIGEIVFLPAADAVNPAAIEAVLARGTEVVWDFKMQGDISGPVWHFNQAKNHDGYGHRMLIVGYDRSDPANPYFLCKNSWGFEDTRIGYDFLAYGEWASYIKSVKEPRPVPDLRWIGRWQIEIGQMPGELDIYHVPGLFQHAFDLEGPSKNEHGERLIDRRLGTLFVRGEEDGPAFRVNGTMREDGLELFINLSKPDLSFDERTGDRVELREVAPDRLEGVVHHAGGGQSPARARRIEVGSPDLRAAPVVATIPAEAGNEEMEKRFAEARERIGREIALGKPLDLPLVCADGRGWRQPHEGADLYLAPGHHPVAIYGDIRALWLAEGAEKSRLGYPLTDELDGGFGRRMSKFENGVIWWHPEKGAWIE